jgi:hypothetical protein
VCHCFEPLFGACVKHMNPRLFRRNMFCVLLGIICAASCGRGMTVTVSNDRTDVITDVTLLVRKGGDEAATRIGTIEPHQQVRAALTFDAESNLIITFRDPTGAPHKKQIDIYLERYHYPIVLHLTSDATVRCDGC